MQPIGDAVSDSEGMVSFPDVSYIEDMFMFGSLVANCLHYSILQAHFKGSLPFWFQVSLIISP
jgi:hypothetical protein